MNRSQKCDESKNWGRKCYKVEIGAKIFMSQREGVKNIMRWKKGAKNVMNQKVRVKNNIRWKKGAKNVMNE